MPCRSICSGFMKTWTRRYRQNSTQFRPTTEGMALEPRLLLSDLPRGFMQVVVARGLVKPSGMAVAPDGRVFVIQQTGELRVIQKGKLLPIPALKVATHTVGERGLVGITLDPKFASNSYIYLYYTAPGSPDHNRLSRFTLSGNTVVPGSEVPLLDLPGLGATGHNGGSLQFGADGKLYLGVGENEVPTNAQSLSTPLGKILRINRDGSIPTDNPFYSQTTGTNRAIWAIGLRNPFSTAVQPGTGLFYINDVGLDTWEKIDKGVAGGNYGWPITENATRDPRFQHPLYVYKHGVNDSNGAAITGGAFYDPKLVHFPRAYVGRYFFGDIKGWIRVYNPANGKVSGFATKLPTVQDALAVGPSGNLYVLSRGNGLKTGALLSIQYGKS
jgi:glucose/arabinose dehydrogenase